MRPRSSVWAGTTLLRGPGTEKRKKEELFQEALKTFFKIFWSIFELLFTQKSKSFQFLAHQKLVLYFRPILKCANER